MTERKNRSYDRNGHIWRGGLNCYNLLSATVLATRIWELGFPDVVRVGLVRGWSRSRLWQEPLERR